MKKKHGYKTNTLYGVIHKNRSSKKTALYFQGEKISYHMLNQYVDSFTSQLVIKNVKKGDRVALYMENCIEYVVAIFAISKLEATIVPMNTFLTTKEIEHIIEDSGAKVLVASQVFEKKITHDIYKRLFTVIWEGENSKRSSKDIHFRYHNDKEKQTRHIEYENNSSLLDNEAVVMYTSGTTGKPKGVILTNRNILSNADAGSKHANITKKDRFIVFLPFFHAFTFSIGIILPLYSGASIVMIRSVKPFSNIVKEILFKRVTIVLGVPDVYKALSSAKLPWYFLVFNNINAFVSGGSSLHEEILEKMKKMFKRADILEAYGLTEAAPTVSLNPRNKQKPNSVGTPFPGYDIRIVEDGEDVPLGEVGEVLVSGDNIMKGYLNNPLETKKVFENEYLKTGDLGYLDEEGYLFLSGRKKDLIISKGMNIYPQEIENVLNKHELVNLSAVVGKLNEKNEEIVTAFIECDLNERTNTLKYEKALKKYLKEYLAPYKIPKQFYFSTELEKNAMGKVNKNILRHP